MVFKEPFPHLLIYDALPEHDYEALLEGYHTSIPKDVKSRFKANSTPTEEFHWKAYYARMICKFLNVTGTPTIGRYMLRKAGYVLDPHADPSGFLATVLHYLPSPGQSEDAGTVLYTALAPVTTDSGGARYSKVGNHTPAKRVPYRANLVLAFPNLPTAIHGLGRLTQSRLVYQWHIIP